MLEQIKAATACIFTGAVIITTTNFTAFLTGMVIGVGGLTFYIIGKLLWRKLWHKTNKGYQNHISKS